MSRNGYYLPDENFLWGGQRTTDVFSRNSYYTSRTLTPASDTTAPKEGYYVLSKVYVSKLQNFEGNQNKLLRRVS